MSSVIPTIGIVLVALRRPFIALRPAKSVFQVHASTRKKRLYDSIVPFEPEVRNPTCRTRCANFGFGTLGPVFTQEHPNRASRQRISERGHAERKVDRSLRRSG
jgi:hypothetical protein